MLRSKDSTQPFVTESHMLHLHDLYHSVLGQCYRKLIICPPEISLPQWLDRICGWLPEMLDISCFGRFTLLKLCFVWRENCLLSHTHKKQNPKKRKHSEWGWDKPSAKEKKKSLWQMNPKLKVFKFTRSL